MKTIRLRTEIINGKLGDNRLFAEALEQFNGKAVEIIIRRAYKQRTNSQNAYYWAVIVKHWQAIIKEQWGELYTTEQVHEFLKTNLNYEEYVDTETGEILLNPVTGVPVRKPKSTTENNTYQQEQYHEACRQLAYEMFGYQIPLPNEKLSI